MAELAERSTRRRSLLGIAAVFLIGLVAGSAITIVSHRFMVPRRPPIEAGGVRPTPGEHLQRRLDLSDEQVTQVNEILFAHRRELRETLEQVREQIRAVLTDEQKVAFDKMPRMGLPPGPRGPGHRRGPRGGRGPEGRRGPPPPPPPLVDGL